MRNEFVVLSDAPVGLAGDRLDFVRYVDALTELVTADTTQTPFTIGVFGAWGSGKSSLLRMLDERLSTDHAGRTVRVHFNPWVHRREPNMLLPLLHTLQDTLAEDRGNRFRETVKRLGFMIANLTTDALLRKISGGSVSVDKINELAEQYAEQRGKVESEIRNLRRTLQEQADAVSERGARLLFFIDDLDRCEPHEIIDLLESVKLFLDLRNVCVILAVAKNVVDRGVGVKYREFGFETSTVIEIGDEYLDKMIQLPLYLPPIDAERFLSGLELTGDLAEHAGLLGEIVVPNPRRIKRVLNSCSMASVIARGSGARPDVLIRLAALRIQSPELYAAVAARPELAPALEDAYAGRLPLDRPDQLIARYGQADADAMKLAVQKFYRAQAYLSAVFADTVFTEVKDELPRYLRLLGS